jgi:hypothetical protein
MLMRHPADASFCGGWLNNRPCLSTCISVFTCLANSFSHVVNYIQLSAVKITLGEIPLDRALLYFAFDILFSVHSL